jgi:hypothetical protein
VISLSTTIIITFFVIDVVKIAIHRSSFFPLYPAVNTSGHIVSNIFIILGITAYLYSPGKLSIKSLRRATRKWTCCEHIHCHRGMVRKRRVNTKPSSVTDDNELVSAEISVEQDIPSYTIALTVPYTDGFTDVAGIVSSHRATKYGTVQVKL